MSSNGTTHDTGPIPIVGRPATWADRFPLASAQEPTVMQDLPPVPPRRATPPPVPSTPRRVHEESSAYAPQDPDQEPETAEVVEPEPDKTEEADAKIVEDYAPGEGPTEVFAFTASTFHPPAPAEMEHASAPPDSQDDRTATDELDELSDSSATANESSSNNPGPLTKLRQAVARMMPIGRRHKSDATDDESEEDSFSPEDWTEYESDTPSDATNPRTIKVIIAGLVAATFLCIYVLVFTYTRYSWWVSALLTAVLTASGFELIRQSYKAYLRRKDPMAERNPSLIRDYWVQTALSFVIGAGVFYGLHRLGTTDRSWQLSLAFAIIMASFTAWSTFQLLRASFHRAVTDEDVDIPMENNFLGDKIHRFLHVVRGKKRAMREGARIDFAQRPHWTQGFIENAWPLQLSALSIWGLLDFPGLGRLFQELFREGNIVAVGVTLIFLVVLVFWNIVAYQEKQVDPLNRVFVLLIAGGLLSFWVTFGFPFGSLVVEHIREDPSWVWWLLAVPSVIWTGLKIWAFLDSAYIIDESQVHKGTINLFLEGSSMNSMSREKMTNSQLKQNFFRMLFGYYLIKTNTASVDDKAFHRLRVKNGEEMKQVLDSQFES